MGKYLTSSPSSLRSPRGKQVGENPAFFDMNADSACLDSLFYRQPRILPPEVNLPAIPLSFFEDPAENSLARLGLRAQRRYGISSTEWSRRWRTIAA